MIFLPALIRLPENPIQKPEEPEEPEELELAVIHRQMREAAERRVVVDLLPLKTLLKRLLKTLQSRPQTRGTPTR